MKTQIPLSRSAVADLPEHHVSDDGTHEIACDLAYKRLAMVNVVYYGLPDCEDGDWVLIDAGLAGTARMIIRSAEDRFGKARPAAIILTHGHFDHTGALPELAKYWDAPVYAHPLERPYLDGTRSYPPPDTGAGGGLMPLFSPLFPRGPIDISSRLNDLPADGSVPGMEGWRWIHTPGHAPGHVSLWRARDRTLVAGDAFITTRQESVYAVAMQKPEMHGPPRYFTPDWVKAGESVRRLAALDPALVVTGHGRAMRGPDMRESLRLLADDFETIAVPEHCKRGTPGARRPKRAAVSAA